MMQIHSPFCEGDLKLGAQWRARNETSGEEILVFVNQKERTFSTNYFSLQEGSNRIVFERSAGKRGASTEKIQINRKAD